MESTSCVQNYGNYKQASVSFRLTDKDRHTDKHRKVMQDVQCNGLTRIE